MVCLANSKPAHLLSFFKFPCCMLLMEEILHRRGHIWQYTMTCTPAPPFQCCVLKLCAPVQDFSHSTSLFWGHFFKPMLDGELEGLDFKCIWWCRIFSINRSTVDFDTAMLNRKYTLWKRLMCCSIQLKEIHGQSMEHESSNWIMFYGHPSTWSIHKENIQSTSNSNNHFIQDSCALFCSNCCY